MKTEATNKMGTVPVKSLMLSMGIPIILSMMLQALYNIVDGAAYATVIGQIAALMLAVIFHIVKNKVDCTIRCSSLFCLQTVSICNSCSLRFCTACKTK